MLQFEMGGSRRCCKNPERVGFSRVTGQGWWDGVVECGEMTTWERRQKRAKVGRARWNVILHEIVAQFVFARVPAHTIACDASVLRCGITLRYERATCASMVELLVHVLVK